MVVINGKHMMLNERLAIESNKLARNFNNLRYSKVEDIDTLLQKRNISVEKKKKMLIKKLHASVVEAFSINKVKFNTQALEFLKKRLSNLRKILIKLRSINYYLETSLFNELKVSSVNLNVGISTLKKEENLAKNELEALEYVTYKLIGEVVMLDKKLLREYVHKEKMVLGEEEVEMKDLGSILRKESGLLEHMEAKLPPPRSAGMFLVNEPIFTHWVARIFALLSYLEYLYHKEMIIFKKLKENAAVRRKISKKIVHLIQEKTKLLKIMQEKATAMKKFRINSELRKELHNITTIITV